MGDGGVDGGGSRDTGGCPSCRVIAVRRAGSLILCYHRVAEGVANPFKLCVSPGSFAMQLEEIARYGEPSTLDELFLPSRRPRVAVTFDDGYADNLLAAAPIAEAKGIPITVYVTSGLLDSEQGFWWDRLGALVQAHPAAVRSVHMETSAGCVHVELGSTKAGEDLRALHHHLLPLPVVEIHRLLDELSEEWSVPAARPPDARTLTTPEFVALAASPVVSIGAHTVDHERLSRLGAEEQLRSIGTSKKELQRLTDREITHFAYPFGDRDSFNDSSVEAVRVAGFETACTTVSGNAGPSSDPYRLPRRIARECSRLRFRVLLQRWSLVSQH